MSEYDIYLNNKRKIIEFILSQPNFVSLTDSGGDKINCVFNHTTEEEIVFKQKIADMIFQIDIGNNVLEDILPKLTRLQSDQPIYFSQLILTKNNVGTTYQDLFNDYAGRRFHIDTTGFTKINWHIYLKLNGSTGNITLRLIDHQNPLNVLFESPILTNGQNRDTGTLIPDPLFKNFRGTVRFQVKSTVTTDSPIFEELKFILRR